MAIFIPEGSAQNRNPKPMLRNAETVVTEERLRSGVEFLCDSLCQGRGIGTPGNVEAGFWIARRMEQAGLMPFGGKWSQSFRVDGLAGHNIIGFYPGENTGPDAKYIIIAAHYDNFGVIKDNWYPGADSNASGVVALLSLADMLERMKDLGRRFGKSVIFVAFDGTVRNNAGAKKLVSQLNLGNLKDPVTGKYIYMKDIGTMVNLDILGSSNPPSKSLREDYLLMLSGRQLVSQLITANYNPGLGLDLCFDYFGSADFTRAFYRHIGDQKFFLDYPSIRTVLFTSGITMNTNRQTDTTETLDYPVLRRRILLIYYWLCSIL